MALRKFVAIMIGDRAPPPPAAAGQRQDRQLHQVEPVDHEVEQADLVGMDDILGVMENDGLVAECPGRLLRQHRAP